MVRYLSHGLQICSRLAWGEQAASRQYAGQQELQCSGEQPVCSLAGVVTCSEEAIDKAGLALAVPPHPGHSLQVHSWVPVAVIQDEAVGPYQIQPCPSSLGGQQADLHQATA